MFNRASKSMTAISATLFGLVGISDAQKQSSKANEPIVTLAQFRKLVSDGDIKTRPVTFKKRTLKLAGVLFLPTDIDESKKHPAIVVVHPGGGIKDQTASLYAYRLAQNGYVTLAFDAAHQGASEGEPRLLEDPTSRVEDVRSAVDYMTTLPFVDVERIGALGICAGGGYAISATSTEHRIKAVATVSAVDIGEGFRRGWRGNLSAADQVKTLEQIGKQRTAEAGGTQAMLIPYVPDTVEKDTEPDLAEAHDYYRKASRWQHANAPNRMLFSSVDKLLAFSAFDQIGTFLTQPLLLIAGSDAESLWQSERALKLANGPKELFVVPGGTHMSLYDQDVAKAMPKLSEFFGKNLNQSAN